MQNQSESSILENLLLAFLEFFSFFDGSYSFSYLKNYCYKLEIFLGSSFYSPSY
jgi:hypothetical protein